uniref:Uncharacterized protein n=1 Tax=Fagus sylvatica TaxID=28930 RepID=A0A2N9GLB5_FAGSY
MANLVSKVCQCRIVTPWKASSFSASLSSPESWLDAAQRRVCQHQIRQYWCWSRTD